MSPSLTNVQDKSTSVRHLLWPAAVVVVACLLAAAVQTSWDRVQVRDIKLPTQNGQWLVADLFKPASATAEAPAPFVVVVPGFQRSKEALAAISIELSRRGVVVIAIDPYAQGSSSSSASTQAATTEGYNRHRLPWSYLKRVQNGPRARHHGAANDSGHISRKIFGHRDNDAIRTQSVLRPGRGAEPHTSFPCHLKADCGRSLSA